MVSVFSPNIQLEEPARGDQVGTWDTPVNSNMNVIDLAIGGVATIALNNSPVTLSAAQFQAKTIIFNSTLTGSVTVTFPTSYIKSYEILNLCSGTSAFTITLATTNPGVNVVGVKPGDPSEILYDGSQFRYKNLGNIGSYWDYAGSSVPNWVSACAIPPYLNCTGTTFSSATYPQLAVILGSTTLPDSKGRARFALDQSAARLSSAVAGFNPNTVGAGGGDQNYQQHTHNIAITDPGHIHNERASQTGGANTFIVNALGSGVIIGTNVDTASAVTGITATASNAGTGTANNMPPAYIGGLTLIRAG